MRLLFVSSSQEAARDGVGDYIRLLAAASARLGHTCALLALDDSFVDEPCESFLEGRGEVSWARLPARLDWPQRIALARAFRDRFQPDWVSLHVVPYAFHPRGFLHGLSGSFRELTKDCRLHLMFHELWLGAGRPSPFRFYVIGFIQRFGIGNMLAQLRPEWVTTSNPVFSAMLRRFHIEAQVLPLFGNIPVLEMVPGTRLADQLLGTEITGEDRPNWWIGIFFGSLHQEWKPEPFFTLLLRAARQSRKRVCLILIGRPGSAGEAIWKKLATDYGSEILFLNRGEQSPEAISALLQIADFGIAASPWQLIGKSGTAAAMLDHGLPVIVTRDDFQPFVQTGVPPSSDPLVHRCESGLETKLCAGLAKRPAYARVDAVASQLVDLLETTTPVAP